MQKKKGWKEGASMLDCEGAVSPKAGLVRERNYWLMFQKFHTGKMSGKLQEKKKKINQPWQSLAEIL